MLRTKADIDGTQKAPARRSSRQISRGRSWPNTFIHCGTEVTFQGPDGTNIFILGEKINEQKYPNTAKDSPFCGSASLCCQTSQGSCILNCGTKSPILISWLLRNQSFSLQFIWLHMCKILKAHVQKWFWMVLTSWLKHIPRYHLGTVLGRKSSLQIPLEFCSVMGCVNSC